MSLRNFYKTQYVAGLRSNPKLCEVLRDGSYVIALCGFPCRHMADAKVEKRSLYDDAVKKAMKAAINEHDIWMKAVKRNRIRESNTRTMSVRPSEVLRPARRFVWSVNPGSASANLPSSS